MAAKKVAKKAQGTRSVPVLEGQTFTAPEKGEKPVVEAKEAKAPTHKAVKAQKIVAPAATEGDRVMLHLKLHGKEFVGIVISDKAHKTVTVEWERRRLIPKYERYERRYSRVYAHNPPALNARHGDTVRIKETRPLSKTKNFVVVEVLRRAEGVQ